MSVLNPATGADFRMSYIEGAGSGRYASRTLGHYGISRTFVAGPAHDGLGLADREFADKLLKQ